MLCCALSYTNSEESFLIKEAFVVGLCRGPIQSGVILVHRHRVPGRERHCRQPQRWFARCSSTDELASDYESGSMGNLSHLSAQG